MPLTATCPPLVIVQTLPPASVIAEAVPMTAVSLGDGACVEIAFDEGVGVWVEVKI